MGWQRVRGHDRILEGFRRAVSSGRLAHAYLFTGPPGIGKLLFATELSRALSCEKPRGLLDACDECPACVQISAGTHPDFLTVSRPPEANEFPVALMRATCASFALKPARGKGKCVVIDDADDFNEESANTFLKTLEEPPPRSLIVLIGSSPERQLQTVVSRCQVVRFAPLPDEIVLDLLEQARQAAGEDFPVSPEAWTSNFKSRLVSAAGGSPGIALSLAATELWDFRRKLISGLASRPFHSVELGKDWLQFLEGAGKEAPLQKRRAALVLRLVIAFLADALAVMQGDQPRRTEPEDRTALQELTRRTDAEQLLAVMDRFLDADEQLRWTTPHSLVLEALLDAVAQKLP